MIEFIRAYINLTGQWSSAFLILLMIGCFITIWLLGRSGRFFISQSIVGKLASLILIGAVACLGGFLFLLNGPLYPYVDTTSKLHKTQGKKIPEIPFALISDDSEYKVSDFHGKVVVLNLWGTYCAPCIEEMKDLNRLHANYKERGAVVITLSDEPKEKLLQFAKKHPLETISGYANSFDWLQMEEFRPYTLIIDKKGFLREHFFGARDYETFEQTVQKYLMES